MATIYWAVYPSAQAEPTAADVIAASVANGVHGNEAAPTGSGEFSGTTITGLTPDTSYKLAAVWSDGTSESNVVVSAAFSTSLGTITFSGSINESGSDSVNGSLQLTVSISGAISETGADSASGMFGVMLYISGAIVETGSDSVSGSYTTAPGFIGSIQESGTDFASGSFESTITFNGSFVEAQFDLFGGEFGLLGEFSGAISESGADIASGGFGAPVFGFSGSISEAGADSASGGFESVITFNGAIVETSFDVMAGGNFQVPIGSGDGGGVVLSESDYRRIADIMAPQFAEEIARASPWAIWDAAPAHLKKKLKTKDYSDEIRGIKSKLESLEKALRDSPAPVVEVAAPPIDLSSIESRIASLAQATPAAQEGGGLGAEDFNEAIAGLRSELADIQLAVLGTREDVSRLPTEMPTPDLSELATKAELEALGSLVRRAERYDDTALLALIEQMRSESSATSSVVDAVDQKIDLVLDNQLSLL